MIVIGPIERTRPGTVPQRAPMAPGGFAVRCLTCGCTTGRDHVPDSDDCRILVDERSWKRRDDW